MIWEKYWKIDKCKEKKNEFEYQTKSILSFPNISDIKIIQISIFFGGILLFFAKFISTYKCRNVYESNHD